MLDEEIFKCQKCGDCCKGYGGTVISEKDIAAIADFIHVSVEQFTSDYCRKSGKNYILTQRTDGFCIFWDDLDLCRIHPVKPKMCRQWPFIQSVLVDPQNWFTMAGFCPGMRTDLSENVIKYHVKAALEQEIASHEFIDQ